MRCDTHLLGSRDGYRPLAWCTPITNEDLQHLSHVDLGQPRSSDVPNLDTQVTACCRTLPSGCIALTRCIPGGQDDAGRATIAFPTLVIGQHDWHKIVAPALSHVLHDTRIWHRQEFADGSPIELPLPQQALPLDYQGAQLFDLLIHHKRQRQGPLLIKAESTLLPALSNMLSAFSSQESMALQWGVGVFSPARWMDIAQCAPGATGLSNSAVQLDHPWFDTSNARLIGGPLIPASAAPQPTSAPPVSALLTRPARRRLGLPVWILLALIVLLLASGLLWISRTDKPTQPTEPTASAITPLPAETLTAGDEHEELHGSLVAAHQSEVHGNGALHTTAEDDSANMESKEVSAAKLITEETQTGKEKLDSDPPVSPTDDDAPVNEPSTVDVATATNSAPQLQSPLVLPSLPVQVPQAEVLNNSDFARVLQELTDALNDATTQLGGRKQACHLDQLDKDIKELAEDTMTFGADFLSPAAKEEAEKLCQTMSGLKHFQRALSIASRPSVHMYASTYMTATAITATTERATAVAGEGDWFLQPLRMRRQNLKKLLERLQCLGELTILIDEAWDQTAHRSLKTATQWLNQYAPDICQVDGPWATMEHRFARPTDTLPRKATLDSIQILNAALND